MKLYAGWYVVGERGGDTLALIAGPVQSRERAEALQPGAQAHARVHFALADGDTFAVAWLAFPRALAGRCNVALWVNPEFQEYDA
jgi:hypothetical protein